MSYEEMMDLMDAEYFAMEQTFDNDLAREEGRWNDITYSRYNYNF